MTDLELIGTDELLAEILGRFEHAIFCGVKCPMQDCQAVCGQWRGNALTCVGLSEAIGFSALQHCQFDEEVE